MPDIYGEIDSLLQQFDIEVKDLIVRRAKQLAKDQPMRVRLTLQDITDYKQPPAEELYFQVEGEIHHHK